MALNKTELNNVVSSLVNEARNAYKNRNGIVMTLSETQKKHVLAESQESKSISAAKKLLADRLGYDEQQADEFVRIKLRNDLPVLRTPQGGKFILGATRMFVDRQLRSANDISNLNSTLKLVASDAHINEYDRNLNGLSCSELIERFSQARTANLEAEKEEVNAMAFDEDSQYVIVRIDSFKQARKYGDYTSWCVTHDEHMFNSYTSGGINQFYFCLRGGFENVEKVAGEGCPLDEYGLSMIAVCVNEKGALNTCTCRWNHDNGGNDSIMSAVEISRVVGVNFFKTFKPNGKWQEILNTALSRLQSYEAPEDVFDVVWGFREGLARVVLNKKYNFLTRDGELFFEQWLDWADDFYGGFAVVKLNGKYNFLTREGKVISQQWFDWADNFCEGFAIVELNDKYNFINLEGKVISQQWFENVGNFREGFAMAVLNGKYNFLTREGKVISQQWFDDAGNFREGFAMVKLNGKYNFITREGKVLSQQWFDDIRISSESFAEVKLNGSWKYLDRNGKLWDEKPAIQEDKKKRTVVLSEAQMKDLILEAMSVADIYQKYYSDIPEDVYQAIVTQADPTYNPQKPDKMGIYTKWLLGMVRRGTFKPGDIKEAHNLLTVFNKFKNKLEVKDVTQLHSMRELYDIAKPFMGQQTTGEKKREAKSGAEKVYEDEKWMIIVPHTEESAKLYGKGTKWCTAADNNNNNMFDYYNKNGLLYIIINKSNPSEKYQFHFESEQFMNAEDEEINIPDFFKANINLCDFFANQLKELGCFYVYCIAHNITHYEIPEGTNAIDDYMFYRCETLTSVTIPNSVTSIGKCAFQHCSGLTSITIPNSVTSIGERAFWGCSELASVTISNSLTRIGESTFSHCKGLTSVTIPNSVTSIGTSAFWDCSGLKSIVIPNSVASIGWGAFMGCKDLTSVEILNSGIHIGRYAFDLLPSNAIIYVPNANVANLLLKSEYHGKIATNDMQESMHKKRTIVLSEAQMKDLVLEAMSVDDIYQKYYSDIPDDVYQTVVTQADPTYNPQKPDKMGIYTKWLLGMVRKGAFKPGDATEARNLLTIFNKFKNKLEVKDVTQLHSMRELYDVVKPFMGQQTNAEKKSAIKQNDIDVAYDDGKWLVIIPHTEEAAKLYGKGTKWCTAADNDNMFDYYHEEGLLYILIDRQNNRKYQVHIESEQFMDEQDNDVRTPRFNSIGAPQGLVNFFRGMLVGDEIVYFMNLQWGEDWEGTSHDNLFKVYFGPSDFNLYDAENDKLIFDTSLNKSGYMCWRNTCEYLYSKEKGYKILTDNGEIIPQDEWLRDLGNEHEGLLPVTKQNRKENYLIVYNYPQDKIGTYLFKDDLAYAGEFDENGFAIAEAEANKKLAIVSDYGEIFPRNFPDEYFEKVNRTYENLPFEVFYNDEWYLMDADGNLKIESDD